MHHLTGSFRKLVLLAALLLAGPTLAASPAEQPRILFMGDSMLAMHGLSGRAVSDATAKALDVPVTDRSVIGAQIIYNLPLTGAMGLRISSQFREGPWDWIVMNGGGNDMWLGCGCGRCARRLGKLINDTGTQGKIPKLVRRLRATGARVIYLGYLRSPGVGSPIENCKDEGDALEARIAAMAARDPGVYFLSLANLVPYGDRSFHALDMIHPSAKASRIIGRMVANLIRNSQSD